MRLQRNLMNNTHQPEMDRVSPLIQTFQFRTFKDGMCVRMSNHICSCVWRARSCVSILYRWLCFLYFTVQQSSFLISSPGCLEASLQTAGVPSCVSWVLRLTLLDLQSNGTYEFTFGTELIHAEWTYCTLIMDNGH